MTYNDILETLSTAGIEVHYPSSKQGVCNSPYVVVQNFGTYDYAQSRRLGYTLIEVHCYVPVNQYQQLDSFISSVKAALAPLTLDLRPTGNEGIPDINDTFRAHTGYIEYMIQKRLC